MKKITNEIQEGCSHDGVDNKEHILDMARQAEMLQENIESNTDLAFAYLKTVENNADQDFVDVVRILCCDILDVEKLAKSCHEKFTTTFDEIKHVKNEQDKLLQGANALDEIRKELLQYENYSSASLRSLIEKCKQ